MSRRARPQRLQVGAEGRIDITIENRTGGTTPLLTATDEFDEGRRAARFVVPPLAPGAIARAAYRIPTRRRGRYQVGPLVVRASDPFGLVTRTVYAEVPPRVEYELTALGRSLQVPLQALEDWAVENMSEVAEHQKAAG